MTAGSLRRRWASARQRRRRPDAGEPLDAMARTCHRLAVLLGAGVPPGAAWGYLAQSSRAAERSVRSNKSGGSAEAGQQGGTSTVARSDDEVHAVARLCDEGQRPDQALESMARSRGGQAWAALAAAWLVASDAGSPMGSTLRALAASCRGLAQTERDIGVALTGPRATARVVVALPFVGVLFGIVMGFDVLHVLFATGPGIICLVVGSALMWAGMRWNRILVRRARPSEVAPGLTLDLLGVAMRGGVSIERARTLVAESCRRVRVPVSDADARAASTVFELSRQAGVPAAELLHAEAEQRRREAASSAQQKAARLAVSLMVPLGCCVLPAFLVLGVAPLLLALLSSTISTLG